MLPHIRIASSRTSSVMDRFAVLLTLVKIKISLLVTFSAAAGYVLTAGLIKMETLIVTAGVLFLACGSCALNQYQERKIDELMERTKSRPLPSRKLEPTTALWVASGLISLGSIVLLYGAGHASLGLGLFAVLWYNGFYTPLKQRTAFAAIIGALVGAIPPILGWVSGGGSILDSRIWGIALFFFIWQVPHFWLLLLDYSKDYDKAGLPSITKIFSREQIKRIIFIWLLSTGISGLCIFSFHAVYLGLARFFLLASTFWHIWNSFRFFKSDSEEINLRTAFTRLNIYAILVLFLLSSDKLLMQTDLNF